VPFHPTMTEIAPRRRWPVCGTWSVLAALAACQQLPSPTTDVDDIGDVPVLVLGTYHMNNPGRDLHNVEADDVLAPRRQAEIERLVNRLATFRPTKICVEVQAARAEAGGGEGAADFCDRFPSYLDGTMAPSRNEVYQIAFRLAAQLGHEAVYPVDVDGPLPFDFAKVQQFAQAHGLLPILDRARSDAERATAEMAELMRNGTVTEVLAKTNEPATLARMQVPYIDAIARIAKDGEYPGTDVVAGWYGRNLRIFANFSELAAPGDRILLLFGAGHAWYLRQFVRESRQFRLEDPLPYLSGPEREIE